MDEPSAAAAATAAYQFAGFELDLRRGCLMRDGQALPLRPRAFAVLTYLVANPRRLVTKQELIDAVWSHSAVTDGALTQRVVEVRRALGDAGAGLIRTIPRRGYSLEAEVIAVAARTGGSPHDGPSTRWW
ncbi:MAG: transcriptional regulator [Gammaproteobacteria bacterium]|nr:transcriptional regulator [Gammaproteobacteria bacterium]